MNIKTIFDQKQKEKDFKIENEANFTIIKNERQSYVPLDLSITN